MFQSWVVWLASDGDVQMSPVRNDFIYIDVWPIERDKQFWRDNKIVQRRRKKTQEEEVSFWIIVIII